jgi:hypothetical protein
MLHRNKNCTSNLKGTKNEGEPQMDANAREMFRQNYRPITFLPPAYSPVKFKTA